MKVAKGKDGYILALKAEFEDGPFRCPECRYSLILKKGDIYTHHFAHNPGEGCALGGVPDGEWTGESQLHKYAKNEIRDALSKHPDVLNLKLERHLGSVRPDISFHFQDIPIAIEFQVSALQPDVIQYRTREYSRRGISILWISFYGEADIHYDRFYQMRDWERIIHAIYGGTFYYWTEGERLQPVHFENAITHKSAVHLSSTMEFPRWRESTNITDLSQVSLPFKFTRESSFLETKLWCIPEVWDDNESSYLSIDEVRIKYPSRFPPVRPFAPLDDPFQVEGSASDFVMRGFIGEVVPDLKSLFLAFYGKYGGLGHKLIWVSIDQEPNKMYFPADWWIHFKLEYLESSQQRKERLLEMLQQKMNETRP